MRRHLRMPRPGRTPARSDAADSLLALIVVIGSPVLLMPVYMGVHASSPNAAGVLFVGHLAVIALVLWTRIKRFLKSRDDGMRTSGIPLVRRGK